MRIKRIDKGKQYKQDCMHIHFAEPTPEYSPQRLAEEGFLSCSVRRSWTSEDEARLESFFVKLAKKQKRMCITLNENKNVYTYISRKVLDNAYNEEEVKSKILHYYKSLQIRKVKIKK